MSIVKFVRARNNFGNGETKEIPSLTDSGAPTTATAGAVGCLYMDTDTGELYKCTSADADAESYIWKPLVGCDSSQNANGLTTAQINALDGMFKVAAYDSNKEVASAYAAFQEAFGLTESGDSGGGSEGGDSGEDGGDTPDTVTYTITNKLTDVTTNNADETAEENAAYTATLTAADGFTLEGASVSVTMGGVDITATAYANGVVSISAVTGNVVITATAAMQELSEYTITNTLNGVTNSNAETTISEGGTYTATLSADDAHVLPNVDMGGSIVVTMGGTDITNSVYNYNTATVSIAPVTGNIKITVNAADKPVIIEDGLQDYFDYRNAVGNDNGDIESVIGDGIIVGGGSGDITADGILLNHSYDAAGTRGQYTDYDGTNHEWTAIFCYLMGISGAYSVPFPSDEVARSGTGHYPIGNYYNTEGTEVPISYDTAVKNDTAGAKLIGIIRNGATERAFYLAKQKNAAVEQVAVFNAADYSDFAYFSPLSHRHRPVSRTTDRSVMTAIYNRALTDEEIAEVVRYFKMEVA